MLAKGKVICFKGVLNAGSCILLVMLVFYLRELLHVCETVMHSFIPPSNTLRYCARINNGMWTVLQKVKAENKKQEFTE